VSTQYPYPPAPAPPMPPQSWMARNWKWFVPMLAVLGLLVIVGFFVGIFSLVHTMMIHSYPYQFAMQRAQESPQVAAEIGLPLHVGWLITGQLNESSSNGTANLQVPISGPHGKGEIMIEAKRESGRWIFQTLEVDVVGKTDVIPLLQPDEDASPKPPGPQI